MRSTYRQRQIRDERRDQEAEGCDLSCAHLESYRTEAAANRALDRIRNFDGFANSKEFPKYAYQCSHVACLRWHLSAQPVWQKGMIESGLDEEEWYARQFGGDAGWVHL